jgi:hypothetical protein
MIMKRLTFLLIFLVVAACADDSGLTAPEPSQTRQAVERTPFQLSVQEAIAARSRDGLPVPEVSFAYASDNGLPLSALQRYAGTPGESFTMVATTTFQFEHPREAGLERWPSVTVGGEVPPEEGFIREGDYTDEFKDYVAERLPGIWETYEYGYEPRTRTITETITVTYGEAGPFPSSMVDDDLAHGLTFTGPNIDWTIGDESCLGPICGFRFEAGFRLDWGFGIRLPMNVSLDSDDPVDEGTTFVPTSTAHGVDWSAADYTGAGIAPEGGNEFVMRADFFLGVVVEVAGVTVVDLGPPKFEEDRSSSFSTPFGPGAVFNLPTIDVPLWVLSVPLVEFEFGAAMTPHAVPHDFHANWMASNELMGDGSLVYTDPAVAQNLSSVFAIDGPASGNLRIHEPKYTFGEFRIDLGAYFDIDIFGLFDNRFDIPITDFDLSSVIPDISVPIHAGASPTELNSAIAVQNVAPTATINVAGAENINGVDVFFADVGEVIPFQGSSHDPGRDDLTLEWDFGDGAPSPDASTSYPLADPTGPNDATEDQPHAFGEACGYAVTFTSTDSDGDSNQDEAFAVIRSAVNDRSRLAGYWQHQLSGNGNVDFGADELGCMLSIVGSVSAVFHDTRDASTVELAQDVMELAGNRGSEAEKLDRELFVAWMNFANGVFDLGDLVDTNFDNVADTPFGTAMASAEMVRLNPAATASELQMQRGIVHDISTQRTGG